MIVKLPEDWFFIIGHTAFQRDYEDHIREKWLHDTRIISKDLCLGQHFTMNVDINNKHAVFMETFSKETPQCVDESLLYWKTNEFILKFTIETLYNLDDFHWLLLEQRKSILNFRPLNNSTAVIATRKHDMESLRKELYLKPNHLTSSSK